MSISPFHVTKNLARKQFRTECYWVYLSTKALKTGGNMRIDFQSAYETKNGIWIFLVKSNPLEHLFLKKQTHLTEMNSFLFLSPHSWLFWSFLCDKLNTNVTSKQGSKHNSKVNKRFHKGKMWIFSHKIVFCRFWEIIKIFH